MQVRPSTHASSLFRAFFVSFLVLSFAAAVSAELLEGYTYDANSGDPVAGVKVLLPGTGQEAGSDATGYFSLDGTPDSPYTIVATHLAYEAKLITVHPMELAGAPLELRMTPTFFRGEKVVIIASRYGPKVHLTQSNLTREDIRRRQDEKDIPLLLENTPGLHASQDAGNGVGYTYLKLRGFDQRRIGVMVNGIPLNDPEDHQVYWVDLPDLASSLEDIQVQRGVSNSLGGMSAIGGSVNLVTEVLGPESKGHLAAAAGSYGTNKQTLSYQTGLLGGRFASGLRISHLESDGYRDRSGSDQWGVFWSGRYMTPNTSTQVNIYTGRELTHHAWDGVPESVLAEDRTHNPETYENAVDDFRQPHYELHHRWNISDGAILKNSLYWIHGEGFYENFKSDRTAEDFSLDKHLGLAPDAEVDLIRRKNVDKDQVGLVSKLLLEHDGGRLVLGGDVYDFQSHHWGDLQNVEGFSPDEIVDLPHYYDYNGDKLAWSVYANEQYEVGGGLTFLADLHYQRKTYDFMQNETGNFTGENRHAYSVEYDFFNPKGGFHWRAPGEPFGGELGFYGHVGVAHREPTDSELFDTWDGPDDLGVAPLFDPDTRREVMADGGIDHIEWSDPLVEEERVMNYEAGAAWRGERLSATINGYLMEFENEIVPSGAWDKENQSPIRGNAEKTLHRGIELGFTAKPTDGHLVRVAASRSWDKYERFIFFDWDENWEKRENNYSGNPIALFPEYLFSAIVDSEVGPATTSLRLRGVGKQYLDNTGNKDRIIDAYTVLDLGVTLSLAEMGLPELQGTTLSLKVNNALDTEYESYGYYDAWEGVKYFIPAAGRHFLIGLRYEF